MKKKTAKRHSGGPEKQAEGDRPAASTALALSRTHTTHGSSAPDPKRTNTVKPDLYRTRRCLSLMASIEGQHDGSGINYNFGPASVVSLESLTLFETGWGGGKLPRNLESPKGWDIP